MKLIPRIIFYFIIFFFSEKVGIKFIKLKSSHTISFVLSPCQPVTVKEINNAKCIHSAFREQKKNVERATIETFTLPFESMVTEVDNFLSTVFAFLYAGFSGFSVRI